MEGKLLPDFYSRTDEWMERQSLILSLSFASLSVDEWTERRRAAVFPPFGLQTAVQWYGLDRRRRRPNPVRPAQRLDCSDSGPELVLVRYSFLPYLRREFMLEEVGLLTGKASRA